MFGKQKRLLFSAEGYGPGAPYYPSYGNYYGGVGNTYVSNVNTVNNYYGPVNDNAPVYSNPGAHASRQLGTPAVASWSLLTGCGTFGRPKEFDACPCLSTVG